MVICLERDADLHMAQLMPVPLTVPCFSKIQIGFTFLVPAHPGSPGQRDVKRVCVCACLRPAMEYISTDLSVDSTSSFPYSMDRQLKALPMPATIANRGIRKFIQVKGNAEITSPWW